MISTREVKKILLLLTVTTSSTTTCVAMIGVAMAMVAEKSGSATTIVGWRFIKSYTTDQKDEHHINRQDLCLPFKV